MATQGEMAITLAEWGKRLDPGGKIAAVVELLGQTNEILDDMKWMQGNLPTGHRTTVRSDLPTVTWRKLNYGVAPSKSRTTQVDEACGMLEAYAEVDKKIADLNGNTASFRLSEDRAFIEAMNQEMAAKLFYGDTATDPEKILGLAPRYAYNDASGVIDAGGSGSDCTSVWLVVWGDNTVHGIFPKGSKAGLTHEDKGQVTLEDSDGGRYEGYRTHYKWEPGLVVRDWRYVVRICNIDTTSYPSDIPSLMVKAMGRPPSLKMGKPVFYINNDLKTQLDIQAMNKSNAFISMSEDPFGEPVTRFRGVPVRRCDALLNTETALTATP